MDKEKVTASAATRIPLGSHILLVTEHPFPDKPKFKTKILTANPFPQKLICHLRKIYIRFMNVEISSRPIDQTSSFTTDYNYAIAEQEKKHLEIFYYSIEKFSKLVQSIGCLVSLSLSRLRGLIPES